MLGASRCLLGFSERQGFLGGEFSDFLGSLQLLTSSHLRERDKMLLRAILCGEEVGTDSFLVRPRRKTFLVVFVGRGMVMVTCCGGCGCCGCFSVGLERVYVHNAKSCSDSL